VQNKKKFLYLTAIINLLVYKTLDLKRVHVFGCICCLDILHYFKAGLYSLKVCRMHVYADDPAG